MKKLNEEYKKEQKKPKSISKFIKDYTVDHISDNWRTCNKFFEDVLHKYLTWKIDRDIWCDIAGFNKVLDAESYFSPLDDALSKDWGLRDLN